MKKSNFIGNEETTNPIKTKKVNELIINGTKSIVFQRNLVTCTQEKKVISKEIIEEKTYVLSKISEKELFDIRLKKTSGFVLKLGNFLYYAEIPYDLNLISAKSNLGKHLCALLNCECVNLTATENSQCICAKVRDKSIEFYSNSKDRYLMKLKNAKRIEKYSFITCGYETFNTSSNVFVVINCDHYNHDM